MKRFWKSTLKTTKRSQQSRQPLKEVVKRNGKINNGYIEVKNGKPTEKLTKNDITVEISMPKTNDTYINDSVYVMTAANGGSYDISNGRNGCNGHVQMARHRNNRKKTSSEMGL